VPKIANWVGSLCFGTIYKLLCWIIGAAGCRSAAPIAMVMRFNTSLHSTPEGKN
jgi:hypothetical protein